MARGGKGDSPLHIIDHRICTDAAIFIDYIYSSEVSTRICAHYLDHVADVS